MQVVKTAVIAMGILILLGLGLLIYGFATRVGKGPEPVETSGLVTSGYSGERFGERTVELLKGEVVQDMETEQGKIVLRTRTSDGVERLRLFDVQSGDLVGTLVLTAAQP